MKPYILLLAALGISAQAQITNPGSAGDYERARLLFDAGNYRAALAQLNDCSIFAPDIEPQACLLKAKTLFALADYDGAAIEYKRILADAPLCDDALFARLGIADCLYAQRNFNEALAAYRELDCERLASVDAANVNYNCAVCAYETGDKALAETCFALAAKSKNTRSAANFYLGVLAFENKDFAKSKSYFALSNHYTEPGNRAPYYLACIDFAQGQWVKALAQAKQVLKACPADQKPELLRVAGESMIRLGQKSEGVSYLRKYLAENVEHEKSALYLVGIADFEDGNYDSAVEILRPVTDSDDSKLAQSAYLFIGQALMHNGDHDAALMSFDKAMSVSGGDPAVEEAAFYNYAVAKFQGAAIPFKSSAATFEKFLQRYPSGPYSERVAEYLAGGYLADKDYALAVERIDRVARPSDALLKTKLQALYALAWSDWQAGDYKSALANLDKAGEYSRLDPATAAEVNLLKAMVLSRQGKDKDAVRLYRAYLEKAPRQAANRAIASYGLGYALYAQKEISPARRAFTDALAGLSGKTKADAYNRLGDLAQATGDFESAAKYYDKSLQGNGGSSDYAALQVAKMKGYQRDYNGKLSALDVFMRDYATSPLIPDALLETTQAQISLGRNADAVETYKKLIAEYPSTSQGRRGYLEMAMTLLDMERRADALDAYRSVISLYPSSEEAAQAASLLKNLYADEGRAAEYINFINSVDNAPKVDAAEAETLNYTSAVNAYRQTGDIAQIKAFINKYSDSKHQAELHGILLADAVQKGNDAEALALAETIITNYPDSRLAEQALDIKASNLYAQGAIPDALALYQQLKDRASDQQMTTKARLGIMRAARDMGDNKLAAAEADALLDNSTSQADDYSVAEALFTKACALEADGKVDEAIELWQAGAANTSDIFGAKSAYRAAEALFESGKSKQALAAAQKFVKSGSKQKYWVARGFILLSDIYKAQGNKFEARQYLEALRDNYPGNETDIKMMIESRLADK